MFAASVVAAVVVFAVAALWSFIGAAGLAGRLPRNRWLGIRTDKTMSSDDAWVLAQRIASPGFLAGALVLMMGGVLALVADWGIGYALGALLLGLLAVSMVSGIAVRASDALPAESTGGCSSGCCSGGGDDAPDAASGAAASAATGGCAAPADGATADDPAADCATSSCGSCALNGMCTPQAHPVDH